MIVGSLGAVAFSVSRNKIETINKLRWNSSARLSTHNRHMDTGLVEYTGNAPEEVSFEITIDRNLGADPNGEISKLRRYIRRGSVLVLALGDRRIGGQWIIKSLKISAQRFDNRGNITGASVAVSLTEYVRG